MRYRIEKDELGELQVPAEAYYGIQTLRSKQNFQISKRPISRQMIKGLATVKKAAARANLDAGLITKQVCEAISLSCDEILNGRMHGQFITDLVQGGAGTSMNMNANEVIANRANEMLGSEKGKYDLVHPLNDVNLCQSSNDVVQTAAKIAIIRLGKKLLVNMKKLANSFNDKAKEYKDVITISKTHMIDSVPITFGQIFSAMGNSIERDMKKIESAMVPVLEINLGGTAVGTGVNADSIYYKKVVKYIAQFTGENYHHPKNLIDCTRNLDAFAWLSAAIKTFNQNLYKIANDLLLLSTAYQSIKFPHIQPGSSVNPGKENPVVLEMVKQVVFYMDGNDLTISRAVSAGEMELNVNLPIILACLFENLIFTRRAIESLREQAIEDMVVLDTNIDIKTNNALITTFIPLLGYEKCREIVEKAKLSKKSVLEVIVEMGLYSQEQLNQLFSNEKIVSPGIIGKN